MSPQYLAPYAKRLVATARMLELAVQAQDPIAIVAAHEAIGRARATIAPRIALVAKAAKVDGEHTTSLLYLDH
jgi:hypothetical protein